MPCLAQAWRSASGKERTSFDAASRSTKCRMRSGEASRARSINRFRRHSATTSSRLADSSCQLPPSATRIRLQNTFRFQLLTCPLSLVHPILLAIFQAFAIFRTQLAPHPSLKMSENFLRLRAASEFTEYVNDRLTEGRLGRCTGCGCALLSAGSSHRSPGRSRLVRGTVFWFCRAFGP